MATYTTNLSLRNPNRTAGDNDIVNVDLDVNDPMTTIDTNMNLRSATADTRPSSARTGMVIYETDTGNIMVWNGTVWRFIGNLNTPKGKMATTTSTGTSGNLTSVSPETLYMSVSFTAEANRRYLVETQFESFCNGIAGGVASASVGIRWAAGGAVANTDALLGSTSTITNYAVGTSETRSWWTVRELTGTPSGTVTVGLFIGAVAAGDTMALAGSGVPARTNYITVRDVGI